MFRTTKNKAAFRKRKTTSSNQKSPVASDDDDLEDPTVIVRRTEKKKARNIKPLSFQNEEEKLLADAKRSRKHKKRAGLGFGGAVMPPESNLPEPIQTSSYGKEALEQLRAEQKVSEPAKNKSTEEQPQPENDALGQTSDPVAITEPADPLDSPSIDPLGPDDMPEEDREWEEQVAARAGIARDQTTVPSPPSLTTLRQQFQSSLTALKKQQESLGSTLRRRRSEMTQSEADWKRHKDILQTKGSACSDYQELRNDLVAWVGALRDVHSKIQPLSETLSDLIVETLNAGQQGWVDLQEDTVSVLMEHDLIDQCIGRQPAIPEESTEVDEFGRDIKSQFRRSRDRRYRTRLEHPTTITDLSIFFPKDNTDLLERYGNLQTALGVALDDLDSQYISMEALLAVFSKWRSSYPQEYKDSYASLSLSKLLVVLWKIDYCRSTWAKSILQATNLQPLELEFSMQLNNTQFQKELQSSHCSFSESLVRLLLQASPMLCFGSSVFSILLVKDLLRPKENELSAETMSSVHSSVRNLLDSMSLPLVKDTASADPQAEHALNFARVSQPEMIQKVLVNILKYWLTCFPSSEAQKSFGKLILEFVSAKYLLLLSPLNNANQFFAPVWMELSQTDLLESPDLMLESAPIRAAARAYELQQ